MKILSIAALLLGANVSVQAHAETAQKTYRFTAEQDVSILVGNQSQRVTIPEQTTITVLETRTDENGTEYVHIGADTDAPAMPADFWAQASEFTRAPLEEVAPDTEGQISILSKGMTYCYKFVKMYLMQHGLVNSYIPGGSAYMAANYLPGFGFHRVGGPAHPRVNEVCVYTGGKGGNGHIEVYTPGGWYYGYGYKQYPITSVNHRLISCYMK